MAKTTDKDNTGGENAETAAPKGELVDQIGTLTYPRAAQHFGKDNAITVMRKVAEIGGHGFFEDEQFKSPLFGGLQMPDPEKVTEPRREEFLKASDDESEREFYFQEALGVFEQQKKAAVENRSKINEFYKSVKS